MAFNVIHHDFIIDDSLTIEWLLFSYQQSSMLDAEYLVSIVRSLFNR